MASKEKVSMFSIDHSVKPVKNPIVVNPTDNSMQFSITHKIFSLIFGILLIASSLCACLTSLKASPYVLIVPIEPVDGQWSSWSEWSQCSITCTNNFTRYGSMSRTRLCNSPMPQNGGKYCKGESNMTTDCIRSPCPTPVNGGWTEWSDWSSCSTTCQLDNTISVQFKQRNCSNPVPKYGGLECIGESEERRFCDWLPVCPVDGKWGSWLIEGACESTTHDSCSLGRQKLLRHCNNPSPRGINGKMCIGANEKIVDCWFQIGCPIDLQPPGNVQLFSQGDGDFNVTWFSVPFGKPAVKYRLYLEFSNEIGEKLDLVILEQEIMKIKDGYIGPRLYWRWVNLKRRLLLLGERFWKISVRISSIDILGDESGMSKKEESFVRQVDGSWSNWNEWMDCNVRCTSERGHSIRHRQCTNPSPSKLGKICVGDDEEKRDCFGTNRNC